MGSGWETAFAAVVALRPLCWSQEPLPILDQRSVVTSYRAPCSSTTGGRSSRLYGVLKMIVMTAAAGAAVAVGSLELRH